MYRPMKIYDAYRLAIETGMKHDPRPKEEVDLVLSNAKKAYDALPEELLLSWTPEQLAFMHDVEFWRGVISKTPGVEALCIEEMHSRDEVWRDWLTQDNPYAAGGEHHGAPGTQPGGELSADVRVSAEEQECVHAL